MDNFLFDFYKIINKIINYILITSELNNNLNYCNNYFNDNNKITNQYEKVPIIFCLGGMAYKMYEKIFIDNQLNIQLESDTYDYDFSLSLNNNSEDTILLFENKLQTIFSDLINNYIYKFNNKTVNKYQLKYKNINYKNFKFIVEKKFDRLQIKINCNIKHNLHILELSFWYNNKISDNFTINDFSKNNIFIYNYNNINFYLLPLQLLVKTTFYAILDFVERRHYDKCYKYIQRIKFIKECNDQYNKTNLILFYIFKSYSNNIRRKYKIINDYPFILAEKSHQLDHKKKYLTRCIHADYRNDNIKNNNEKFDEYKLICENKVTNKQ